MCLFITHMTLLTRFHSPLVCDYACVSPTVHFNQIPKHGALEPPVAKSETSQVNKDSQ